jgi:flagellar biosynthetic protein FlhB
MALFPDAEKTEQPTPRRLEEAVKRGQWPRSAEVQTVFVLLAGLIALKFFGPGFWHHLVTAQTSVLGHLHDITLTRDALPRYAVTGALWLGACVGPIVIATVVGGLLAGTVQNRFQTASEALAPDWNRVNPVSGFQRLFSMRSAAPTAIAALKLGAVVALSYSELERVFRDPIFYTTVDVARMAEFLAGAAFGIAVRVGLALAVVAALDYAYQYWRTNRDLMMTKEEVKEELKHSEGDPMMKARMRRRRAAASKRKMLAEVPKADVVVTNPTHLAVALRYDPKTMKAPRIVAKGSRLNALRIREIAQQHQVPIVENKPLARLMFKYGQVGGEIPAQLYQAVAEILAWVYRVNRYRYYALGNQLPAGAAPAAPGGA